MRYQLHFRNEWANCFCFLGDVELVEAMRKGQAHFGRHSGARGAPSSMIVRALRKIVKEKAPGEGPLREDRHRLRHEALNMLSIEVNASLDDEAYRELLAE